MTKEEASQLALVDDILLYHEFAVLHRVPLAAVLPEKRAEFDFSFRDKRAVEAQFLHALKNLYKKDIFSLTLGINYYIMMTEFFRDRRLRRWKRGTDVERKIKGF